MLENPTRREILLAAGLALAPTPTTPRSKAPTSGSASKRAIARLNAAKAEFERHEAKAESFGIHPLYAIAPSLRSSTTS